MMLGADPFGPRFKNITPGGQPLPVTLGEGPLPHLSGAKQTLILKQLGGFVGEFLGKLLDCGGSAPRGPMVPKREMGPQF
jgi:hypothetical protein